ncbi:MAG: PD-(D/E)XK nuclease family protein, partial [Peptostreptococcus sp.]|nr:PD-(D/E)XK nuclease family protein [Peptostreptococcus sp.]
MGLARERLIISHPVSSFKGDTLKMSSLIKKLMKIFPSLKMESFLESDLDPSHIYDQLVSLEERVKAEKMLESSLNYDNRVSSLNANQARILYGQGIFSVSKLEKYAACPFSYFMNYGLAAKERPINEFSPMDSGIYSHKILDEFSKYLAKNSIPWREIEKDYIGRSINQISNELIKSRAGYILDSSEKY